MGVVSQIIDLDNSSKRHPLRLLYNADKTVKAQGVLRLLLIQIVMLICITKPCNEIR